MLRLYVAISLFSRATAASAGGAELHVPADFATIQSCIEAAVAGDTCLVAPGTYNELIDFGGKGVHLRSEGGAAVTTIDGAGLEGPVVTCVSGEGPATVLEGFTITGGIGAWVNELFLGGGMYIRASSPTVVNCEFVNNEADAGGGLYNDADSNTTISGCTFRDNHARVRGGGIYSNSAIAIEDSHFTGNTSDVDAGAIRNYEGELFVRRCTFRDNHAVQVGGAIASLNYYVLIEDSTFEANSATDGGAMWREDWYQSGEQPVRRTNFVANAATQGGAVSGGGVVLQFESCTFTRNIAADSGGAIFWSGHDAAPKLIDCQFLRNRAATGGAMRLHEYVHGQIFNTAFHGNIAEGNGGAIATSYGSTPVVINSVFSGNAAEFGGAVFSEYSGPVGLVNCALIANAAHQEGGAVFGGAGIINSILWGNHAPSGEQVQPASSGSGTGLRHSNIQGSGGSLDWDQLIGRDEGGNMDADPKFVRMPDAGGDGEWGTEDDDYGDAHLLLDSPCTDMGDDDIAAYLDNVFYYHSDLLITTDFDGQERIQSCSIDIGPDEAAFVGVDCNGNEENDACDVLAGLAADCNSNRVPDDCDVGTGARPDCDGNGIPDECDIADDPSLDCNLNELPDECEPLIDCNGNLLRDDCETRDGTTKDCNDNFVPDTCEPDALPAGLYVDDDAPEGGDGLSWNTAFRDLQKALAWSDCDLVQEIRIAGGTYKPGYWASHTFQLGGQSDLIGGFAGLSGPDPHARDIAKYETILSGDVGSPNNTSDDCNNVVTVIKADGEPVLDGLTITRGNARSNSRSFGGGVYSSYTNLTLRRCKFIDNKANFGGGGLHINGPVISRVEDCTFVNNTAGYFGGGGVRVAGQAQVTFANCFFEDNYAANGGALKVETTLVVVEQCHFRYNQVESYSGGGGAIANFSGTLLVSDSLFEHNFAESGGAVRIASSAAAHLERCDFRSNLVRSFGSGGALALSAIATVKHCDFEDNTAAWSGGAITNDGGVAEIRDCNFLRNTAGAGGAVSNRNAVKPLLANCFFAENTADSGGALFNEGTSAASLLRCNLERNMATGQTNTTGWGGAIYNVDESAPRIADSRIVQNTAVHGGGMYSDEASAPLLIGSELLLNHATGRPGVNGRGGGTYSAAGTAMIAKQTEFVRNRAQYGGAVYNASTLTEIWSSSLLGNTAASSGGGIRNDSAMAQLSDTIIVGNRAGQGGGLFNFGAGQRVTNCTFAKNHHYAVFNWGGLPQLANSIVWQNWTGDAHPVTSSPFMNDVGGRIFLDYCDAPMAGVDMSVFPDPYSVDAEPLVIRIPVGGADGFADDLTTPDLDESANDDYGDLRLLPMSPGVNQGDPAFVAAAGQADRDGHSRVLCGRVDIGAYESGIGDFNCDDVLDAEDFAAWTSCMAGPGSSFASGCEAFDFDADGDADLADYTGVLRIFAHVP